MKDGLTGRMSLGLAMVLALSGFGMAAQGQDEVHVTKIALVNVRVMLGKGLDARKSKPGDEVTARTENDVKLSTGQSLPHNTVVSGHVSAVQASENKGDSTIAITFDKAQVKGAEPITIKTTIMAISGPPNMTQITGQTPGSAEQAVADAKVGIPGVTLTSSPADAVSGTLTSKGKNVHVPDGAQFTLGVAVLPPSHAAN